ncbi:MAG TPA: hypothetical protein VLM79_22030, partial [Kofleriaceae bacterium]|nr:hypothetical protein [Kofleriaceae bacterium]
MQSPNAPPSTLHWICVAPPVTVNVTSGVLSRAGVATSVTVTTGGTVSTVQVRVAGDGSTTLAGSLARARNVWLPSASVSATG